MHRILAATLLSALLALLAFPALGSEASRRSIVHAVDLVLAGHDVLERTNPSRPTLFRSELGNSIAHYQFDIQVGSGAFDTIRMHRVVREHAPWRPIRTRRAVFLTHGDGWAFEANFLPAGDNLAGFLADAEVDVWGIDFRWALVPPATVDLSFMANWDFGTSVDDLGLALAIARGLRGATGNGFGRLHLAGFSRGGQLGWAHLGAETQRPGWQRHVKGYIAIDHAMKTDDEALRQADCDTYDAIQAQIAGGQVSTSFEVLIEIGDLATNTPDDASPFFPSLDNADLAEWVGASPGGGAISHFHAVAGTIDPTSFETELINTLPSTWFDYLSAVAPFQPLGINLDGAAISCDEIDVPYDDHLAEIVVPVLYVGADGGFGALGVYQTNLIASTDVSLVLVDQAADPALDVGHNELFLANDAAIAVWQPILDWIEAH